MCVLSGINQVDCFAKTPRASSAPVWLYRPHYAEKNNALSLVLLCPSSVCSNSYETNVAAHYEWICIVWRSHFCLRSALMATCRGGRSDSADRISAIYSSCVTVNQRGVFVYPAVATSAVPGAAITSCRRGPRPKLASRSSAAADTMVSIRR